MPPRVFTPRLFVGDVSNAVQDIAIGAAEETFTLVIAGGSLPGLLSAQFAAWNFNMDSWRVFLADERLVPPEHADSNYRAVTTHMVNLGKALPVFAVDHTLPPAEAAAAYQEKLADAYKQKRAAVSGDAPKIDLALLGMGPDGHVCSLFPGHPRLDETEKMVTAINDSPTPPASGIAMTYAAINQAHNIVVVANGANKADAVKDILENPNCTLPAARFRDGHVSWYLDAAAAGKLEAETITRLSPRQSAPQDTAPTSEEMEEMEEMGFG